MSQPTPLATARARIRADLEARQGPWRRQPLPLRLLRLLLPTLVVVVGLFLLTGARGVVRPTVVFAALASALALFGVSLAPERPALSERLSQLGSALAVLAVGVEMTCTGDVWALTPMCMSVTAFFSFVMAAATAVSLLSSGAPLRAWHKVGLATATTLGSCAAIWHACPGNTVTHVWIAHGLGPVVAALLIVLVVGRLHAARSKKPLG